MRRMACRKCGTRMVSKAARGPAPLICAGCGHPVDGPRHDPPRARLASALTMIAIVLTGGVILFLASINESRHDLIEPAAVEQPGGE